MELEQIIASGDHGSSSMRSIILTGKPNPWTVWFVRLTMMPMEIGSGLALGVRMSVTAPLQAIVSVDGSAACAVIDRPATIAVRAMADEQVRSIVMTY